MMRPMPPGLLMPGQVREAMDTVRWGRRWGGDIMVREGWMVVVAVGSEEEAMVEYIELLKK